MPNFLFDGSIKFNDRNIAVRVTGAPGSEHDGQPFVLVIPSLGQSRLRIWPRIFEESHQEGDVTPHFIEFDFPGCGDSETAENPATQYSIQYFTQVAAAVVEAMAEKLALKKMNLQICSYGSPIAINIPMLKPEWTDNDSPIRLQTIFSNTNINGMNNTLSPEFLRANYPTDPDLQNYIAALARIHEGNIRDRDDFLQNVLGPLSRVWSDRYNKIPFRLLLRFGYQFPNAATAILKGLDKVFTSRKLESMYKSLDFSLPVFNQLYSSNWGDFELVHAITAFLNDPENLHKDVYSRVAIIATASESGIFTSGDSHITHLREVLPSVAGVVFPGKDHDPIYAPLFKAFFSGDIQAVEAQINHDREEGHARTMIPPGFSAQYQACLQIAPEASSSAGIILELNDGVIPVTGNMIAPKDKLDVVDAVREEQVANLDSDPAETKEHSLGLTH